MRWLLILLIAATNGWAMRADINGDHRVDFLDFSILASEWLETDMSNSYAVFNGTDGYISVPHDTALNLGTGDFTICFWTKSQLDTFGMPIVGKFGETGNYWAIWVNNNEALNRLTLEVGDGSSNLFHRDLPIPSISPSAINVWTHICFIKTSTKIDAYANAVFITGTGIYDGTPNSDNSYAMSIGTDATNFLSGSLDDLRIYKAALTAGEIAEIYNGGIGKKYTALSTGRTASAAFNFDEGIGSYTLDAVGGLLGTLNSGVTWSSGGVPFAIDNSIEESMYYLLANNAGVTGKVSTRIYPSIVPQSAALPCVTYQQISGVRDQELAIEAGFVTSRFQINCWAATYAGARELADVVRTALSRQSGTVQGKYIYDIQLEDENDMPQVDAESDIISRYGKRLDFQVFFNE